MTDGKGNGTYRSKTPTAELYSSRDKESVMISRPKTPLVDTRNWPVSSSDFQNSNENQKLMQGSANISNSFYNHRPATYNQPDQGIVECSPDRHGNPSWYSDQGRGRDWHNHNYRDSSYLKENDDDAFSKAFVNGPIVENSHHNFVPPHLRNSLLDPVKRLSSDNKFHFNQEIWRQEMHRHNAANNNSMFQPGGSTNNSNSLFDNHLYTLNENRLSFENSGRNFMYSQPFYKPHIPSYHLSHFTSSNLSNSLNSPVKESPEFSDAIYGNNMQNLFPSSAHTNNVMRYDQSIHRKHGTSFEHEQPVPYNSNECSSVDFKGIMKMSSREDGKIEGNNYQEMTVTLQRQESGFGFRIIGGTEEGSQVSLI